MFTILLLLSPGGRQHYLCMHTKQEVLSYGMSNL